jgi:hypothetical protein
LNHAIRTTRYKRRVPYYSAYTKPAGRTKNHNWQSVIAKKIIIQSLACILIIFFVSWLQNQEGESAENIVSQIRFQVVEKNTTTDDIFDAIANTYEECFQYLQGNN